MCSVCVCVCIRTGRFTNAEDKWCCVILEAPSEISREEPPTGDQSAYGMGRSMIQINCFPWCANKCPSLASGLC